MNVTAAVPRWAWLVCLGVVAVGVGGDIVSASNVVAGLGESNDVSVPTLLYLATGGAVVGASALLSMLVTDRSVIDQYHQLSVDVSVSTLRRGAVFALGTLGIVGLGFLIVVGFVGPQLGNVSAAVLVTFVGVRAWLTMITYTIGNPWPAINPWRHIALALPHGYIDYPQQWGSWPAVIVLLGFVWLEIVAPLSSVAWVLSAVLVAYSGYTIAGAILFGPDTWFERADPLAIWFRLYGAVAPVQRTEDGLSVRIPGARLSDDVVTDLSTVAFVIALVWELTYSGLVVTPPGARLVEILVGVGLPPAGVYLGLLVGGFVGFCWAYWAAAERTRVRAESYITQRYLALRFAPPLLAIAAGYHVAHYLGFAVALSPSLLDTLVAPFSPPPNPTVLALPGWFGYVEIGAILVGHILAIWVAHTVSFELFPRKLQAIRSQYPVILVMVVFTVLSLWLVSLPTINPPYAAG